MASSGVKRQRPRTPKESESDYLDSAAPRKKVRSKKDSRRIRQEKSNQQNDASVRSKQRVQITSFSSEDELERRGSSEDEDVDDERGADLNDTAVPPAGEDEDDPVVLPSFKFNAPSRVKPRAESQLRAQPAARAAAAPPRAASTSSVPSTFAELGVQPWLEASLASMAIRRPTNIQRACIPEILKGRDCLGISRTGSGKTMAFAVPILEVLSRDPTAILALVLTPTRELAMQIYEQFMAVSARMTLRVALVIGGADRSKQATELAERPHVVIATPGRLMDHIWYSGEDTICGLRRVQFLVLDEADRLLDPSGPGSMLPAVKECLAVVPPPTERQALVFTATKSAEIQNLINEPTKPGKQPAFVCEINTDGAAIPESLHQTYIQVPATHREHYLHQLLLTPLNADKTVIIFCNRAATVTYLHHLLWLLDHRITSLHSKLPQRERTDNLGRFRASAARILIATDLAARGLDIPEVALVINYDMPRDPADYIHRVGRTARAGRKGEAVSLIGQRDVDLLLAIESEVRRELLAWSEEGVNLETRVTRDKLKLVSEKRREAMLEIEEGVEVGGARKNKKVRLRPE